MNLTTASRTFQLLTRILDTQSATEAFLPTEKTKLVKRRKPAKHFLYLIQTPYLP